MDDIAPALLAKIQKTFNAKMAGNGTIKHLTKKIKAGTITYAEAHQYSAAAGDCLAAAFKENLSSEVLPNGKLYYNIAQRILQPTFERNHQLAAKAAESAQKSVNKQAKIGLKVKSAKINQDKIDGIINRISIEDQYDDVSWILQEPVTNFTQSVVDDTLKANMDFHSSKGLHPRIIRRTFGRCCSWCESLAGTYNYPEDVPDEVFHRHLNCRCTTEYAPDGAKRQDVWSKDWNNNRDDDIIQVNQNTKAFDTKHLIERKNERNISERDIEDALQNPLAIKDVKTDKKGRKSVQYIGEHATIVINPDTKKRLTTWPTSTKRKKKYKKRG